VPGPSVTDLSKSPARIAKMFDGIAPRYDLLNHLLSAGIDRRWRRRAIRSLALSGRERILDLCTGTGDLAIAARTAEPPAARVIGVDFARAMLGIGRAKLSKSRLADSVALVCGDATLVPIASRSVNGVTMAFGIRNVENIAAACAEIHRVLAPGGRFAVLEFGVPATPFVRGAYLWYFNHILPRIGRLISGDDMAYEYLPASVGAFASPDDLVKLLRQAGLMKVTASPLSFGIVYLYTGCRAES
jgi:demethylmenaquinone methyltransferase/2-methoxy-6-polyprenyl-1,4-benzoquinol methylase